MFFQDNFIRDIEPNNLRKNKSSKQMLLSMIVMELKEDGGGKDVRQKLTGVSIINQLCSPSKNADSY